MNWTFNKRGEVLIFNRPVVMAIVNLTPDSFYASSRVATEKDFIERVERFIRDGATIIDIGGESTNPKAKPVNVEEEWRRIEPYLRLVNKYFPNVILSVDTMKAEIIKRTLDITAVDIVNDVSGCPNIDMVNLIINKNLSYVLTYVEKIATGSDMSSMRAEMLYWLAKKKKELTDKGVVDIIVDPGFGFNKNIAQNYNILSNLRELTITDSPILVGVSRKRMLYELLKTTPDEVGTMTSVLHYVALQQGGAILRTHDVKEAIQTIKIYQQLC